MGEWAEELIDEQCGFDDSWEDEDPELFEEDE